MPSNPIQRKTRNSFLLGMLIMLIIAIVVAAILYFTVFTGTLNGNVGGSGTLPAYVLTSEIKSGDSIASNKIEVKYVNADTLPKDYVKTSVDVNALKNYKSKLTIQAGTVLTTSLLYQEDMIANSTRLIEYNMLTLPSTLRVGDYIDVRFTMPSGQNYIVLSKKQVMNIQNTTITLYLTEDEILMMSSAIIESYIMKASDLHVVQYLEAGMQESSVPTYSVSEAVHQLITKNSQNGVNIEDYAKINASYSDELRRTIESELSQYAAEELTNIQEGIEEQKKESMELYLSGLEGY